MPAFDREIFRIFWTMSEMNKALNTLVGAGLIVHFEARIFASYAR